MIKVAKFTFQVFGINTYVLTDEATRECAIVDPGMFDETERAALEKYIGREHLIPTHLINTHAHIDHLLGNAFVIDRYNLRASRHSADDFLADRAEQQAYSFGLPASSLPNNDDYIELHDGDTIRLGQSELEVIHVPGHSPGGIALYDKADGFLIAGDILFRGSIGRADLPGGDMDALVSGIRERLLTLPDTTVVYPGHGEETNIGFERRNNPFLI